MAGGSKAPDGGPEAGPEGRPVRPGPHPEPDQRGGIRARLYRIVFESGTPAGKTFDVLLIVAILVSVGVVMIDSIPGISPELRHAMWVAEWCFTVAFTVEYVLRLWVVQRPSRYARSFFGIVDLLAILPTYIALIVPGAQYLLVIRVLRVLRIFRVLRLAHFVGEADIITRALMASRHKIGIFIFTVVTAVTVLGSLLYIIEGPAAGFDSIPRSVYWAIVTLTTVGYGDIAPDTPLGQAVAAAIMLLGYGMIAVPTGIFTVEMGRASGDAGSGSAGEREARGGGDAGAQGEPRGRSGGSRVGAGEERPESEAEGRTCPGCGRTETDPEARYCRYCGEGLGPEGD